MKKFFNLLSITFTLALTACSSHSSLTSDSKNRSNFDFAKFSAVEDGSLTLPQFPYETWTLENGLKVYFVNDPELPLTSAALLIPGGSFWEQANEHGLYQALGDNMRAGGAGNFSPQALDREIEKYAASISSSFGQEFGSVSFSSLSTDFDHIFSIMSDVLLRPRFDRERLSLWKGQSIEGIKRRVDDPMSVAGLSMRELLIGGSSYGAITNSQDITGITRQKLNALHAKAVIPNGALLAISGNITRDQAEQAVKKYLGSWKKAATALPAAPSFPLQKNSGIYFIEQPLAQATILIGQLGPERFPPDQYAIEIFNQYFGSGGFGSVLMKRIRTEMGLAYGVFGSILPGLGHGRALINLQTKPASSGPAIVESLKCLTDAKNNEITQSDLIETRKGITNTFIFNFTSPSQVLARKVQSDLLGYPKDYDQKYLENIRAVTTGDIKAVANNRWNFNDFVVVIVGPKSALDSLQTVQPDLPAPLNSAKIKFGRFDEVLKLTK